jgi:hypothetical protein
MIRIFTAAGTAALLAGTAAHSGQAAPAPASTPRAEAKAPQQDFHWRGRLASGEQIQINNVIGDIRAEPADGDEVVVTGVRHGRNAERVRIEVVRRREGTVICAVYPPDGNGRGWRDDDDDDDRGPRDACNPRSTNSRDGDASVDFTVRVPASVKLAARTVSGNVEALRLRGPVDARSVSGNVRVSTAGPVQASSVSGSVTATLGRMGRQDLTFRSVSGDVTLEVPAGIDAEFQARTLSGSIESDFPLLLGGGDEHGVRVGQQAHATLGRGGPALHVTTVSGDVVLRRSR